jgi:hypothetical protein
MKEQVDALLKALTESGCDGARDRMPDLIAAIKAPLDEGLTRKVLDRLRSQRCFPEMAEFATEAALVAQGPLLIYVKRQLAQAWIERRALSKALALLDGLAQELEHQDQENDGVTEGLDHVAGLTGRAFKQQFVDAVKGGATGEKELRAAVEAYARGFKLGYDPGWHGSNVVALVARAERSGFDPGVGTAEKWARDLLRALQKRARASWGPWDYASAGEAYLALRDEENVADCFAHYWNMSNADGFALAGTERNLREIWQITSDSPDELQASLVLHLQARKLTAAKGGASYTPTELQKLAAQLRGAKGQAEATFGAGSAMPLLRVLHLLERAKSVCRISDSNDPDRAGTGFLVSGAELGGPADSVCVLTNHHVLYGTEGNDLRSTTAYAGAIPVERAQAEFHFWGGEPKVRTFKLKQVVCHSPRHEKDFALATLDEPVQAALALPLSRLTEPLIARNMVDPKLRDKVILIGHPNGGQISFSVSDNEVVDHELDDSLTVPRRRIHYRTPTEKGSSGSPVFHHKSLEVVGLHRTGGAEPLRPDWPRSKPDERYEANEAISIRSLLNL